MTEVTENSDFLPPAVTGGSGNLRPSPPNKRRPTTGNTLSRPSVEESNFPDEGGECDNPKQSANHGPLKYCPFYLTPPPLPGSS